MAVLKIVNVTKYPVSITGKVKPVFEQIGIWVKNFVFFIYLLLLKTNCCYICSKSIKKLLIARVKMNFAWSMFLII